MKVQILNWGVLSLEHHCVVHYLMENLKSLNGWFHLVPMSILWTLTEILSFILCWGWWKVRFCQNSSTKWCIAYYKRTCNIKYQWSSNVYKKLSSMKSMMFHEKTMDKFWRLPNSFAFFFWKEESWNVFDSFAKWHLFDWQRWERKHCTVNTLLVVGGNRA